MAVWYTGSAIQWSSSRCVMQNPLYDAVQSVFSSLCHLKYPSLILITSAL